MDATSLLLAIHRLCELGLSFLSLHRTSSKPLLAIPPASRRHLLSSLQNLHREQNHHRLLPLAIAAMVAVDVT
jgi:hypothetical protein